MKGVRIVAMLLVLAGTLGLVNGQFSYRTNSQDATVGSIAFSARERQTVNVPVWAGLGAVIVGAALLLARKKEGA